MSKRLLGCNIAIKTENFDAAVKKYSAVFGVEPLFFDESALAMPGHRGAAFSIGDALITLLTGNPDTAVARFCEKRGEGVFLLACHVDDVAQHMKDAVAQGVIFTTEEPITFGQGGVAFAHPKSMNGVQWEFRMG